MVRDTPFYKALIAHASKLEQTVSDYEKEINQLKFKIQQLEAARLEVERQAHVSILLYGIAAVSKPSRRMNKRKPFKNTGIW